MNTMATIISRKISLISITLAFVLLAGIGFAAEEIRPVSILQPMPDFTLPVYQGGEIAVSQLKGKNVLLIFLRGYARENSWCHVCNYQYAELAELEKSQQIRKKYNVEILFVLPYSKEIIEDWVAKFPDQLVDIEKYKNPPEPEKIDEKGKARVERMKKVFPKSFSYEKGKVPLPFPIIVDAERILSKGLGIFAPEWSGSKVDQNIPTIYIIDPKGIVQFKYISQNTFDRPGPDYLLKFISFLNKEK